MPIRSHYGIRSKDREARELKQHMNIPAIAGGAGADHGALTGLGDDDHANYVHLTAARSIQAQHTYSPVSPAAPFALAANAQGQLVTGLKADQLDKDVIAGAGLITGGTLTSDVTIAVATANTGIIINADSIELALATTSGLSISSGLLVGAGDGINVLTNTIEVDVTDLIGAGLVEIATNNIGLADSVAGVGLAIDGSKILSVNAGTGLGISGDNVIHATGDSGDLHTNYAEHDQTEVITGSWTFSTDLLPSATDTYDIGSSTKLWKTGWLSELEAVLFVTDSVRVEAGWLVIAHDGGKLAADINASQTTIDFGKAMTTGDFVVMRGNLKVEYIEIVSLSGGTTYNVSRGLSDSGTGRIWPGGQAYLVLGKSGDARIELTADNTDSPKISMMVQGATYNAQTEYVRLGNMRNSFGVGSNDYWGLGVGDFSGGNYLEYNSNDGFEISAGDGVVTIDDSGITLELSTAYSAPRSIEWEDSSGNSRALIGAYEDVGGIQAKWDVGDSSVAKSGSLYFQIYGHASYPAIESHILNGGGGDLRVQLNANASGDEFITVTGNSFDGLYLNAPTVLSVPSYTLHVVGDGYFSSDIFSSGDIRVQGGMYVGGIGVDPGGGHIIATTAMWVNETVNTKLTQGLTLNQTYGDEIFSLKATGVSHGMTTETEDDTFGYMKQWSVNSGGLTIYGLSDGSQARGLSLHGAVVTDSTTRSSAGVGIVTIDSHKKSGIGSVYATPSTGANLLAVRSNGSTVAIFSQNGNAYLATGKSWTTWDEHDDVALLKGLRGSLTHFKNEFIEYARPILEKTGVVTYNDDGIHFVNVMGLQWLTIDTFLQKITQIDDRLDRLERRYS